MSRTRKTPTTTTDYFRQASKAPAVFAAALAAMALLTGCEIEDGPACVKSHTELMTTAVPGPNGTATIAVVPYEVCDEYAKESPSGKP